ncbi:hypothetical protein SAY86_015482 [Trapa natans]|uniref:FAS1 domain-containing protein n=1 Tax=Trapa natans TaxID=22666 RepID=A0AAN7LAI6_TRANT|nr:hypothetical protein SAY86_015482 [Trapa natans]
MANFLLFIIFTALLVVSTATTAAACPEKAINTRPLRERFGVGGGHPHLQQFYNIIDALIGSGDFGNWGKILSTSDPSMFPLSATLFVPNDSAFSSAGRLPSTADSPLINPVLLSYHIVPQRLAFSDLTLFPVGSHLPTLIIGRSILITNNSRSNFTLNGSHLTQPDLFSTATVSVHGITDILNFTTHEEPNFSTSISPIHKKPGDSPSPLPPHRQISPTGTQEPPQPPITMDDNVLQASRSGALSTEILGTVFCLVLGLIRTVGI